MPSSMDQGLLEIQKSLLGFASSANELMKEQLEFTLKILIELNAQINYTNAMRSMLHADIAPADLNKKLMAINSGLTYQNEVLTKLQKELPKTIFLNNKALTSEQKEKATNMFNALGDKIQSLQDDNKNLLEEARLKRLAIKRGEPEPTKVQDQIVAPPKPGKVS